VRDVAQIMTGMAAIVDGGGAAGPGGEAQKNLKEGKPSNSVAARRSERFHVAHQHCSRPHGQRAGDAGANI